MKIYTRTGDEGETSLFDGTRVRKDDARVDAYGDVDELNAWLGLARSSLHEGDLDEALTRIQRDLFAVGAELADPGGKIAARVTKADITAADVERLEQLIDRLEDRARAAPSLHPCGWRAGRRRAACRAGGVPARRTPHRLAGTASRSDPAALYQSPVGPAFRAGSRGQQASRSRRDRVVVTRTAGDPKSVWPQSHRATER